MASERSSLSQQTPALKLLTAYLAVTTLEEAATTMRGRRLLWLEILVNDQLDLSSLPDDPVLHEAYVTACRWYTHYRRLLSALLLRAPLPFDAGPIDFREYRTFAEALSFVCHHP